MKKIIIAVIFTVFVFNTAAYADTNYFKERVPVNYITADGELTSIEYSNSGLVWTAIPDFVQIGEICAFEKIDARMIRAEGGSITGKYYSTDIAEKTASRYSDLCDAAKTAEILNDTASSQYKKLLALKGMIGTADSELDLAAARTRLTAKLKSDITSVSAANVSAWAQAVSDPVTKTGSIWQDITGMDSDGSKIASVYQRIYSMAACYSDENSSLYKNAGLLEKIRLALSYADKYWYNSKTSMEGYTNWWEFIISVPQKYTSILGLLWEDIPYGERELYAAALEHFCRYDTFSGVTSTGGEQEGANLVNIADYDYRMGVLTGSVSKMNKAKQMFDKSFEYAKTGKDGFYADGSFLQHGIPYNGNYGREFLISIVDMLEETYATRWGFSQEQKRTVEDWIENGYMPLVFDGSVMSMVNGRAIARANTEKTYGYQIGREILKYASLSDDTNKRKAYYETVKYWFTNSNTVNGISWKYYSDPLVSSVMKDSSYAPRLHYGTGIHIYNNMARVAAQSEGNGWAAGIAMYSDAIAPYEYMSGQNMKGWYTSAGAVYLYTAKDDGQYSGNYWYTADMYRIPGTTVDQTERVPGNDCAKTAGKPFVKAAKSGKLAAVAMDYAQRSRTPSSLTAHKSYFIFDKGIICMGSGISGGNGTVTTTVDQRAVSGARVLVNGGENGSLSSVETIHISGECGDIGYYFPHVTKVVKTAETREGSLSEINSAGSGTKVKQDYLTFTIPHGNSPSNASYCYAMLPSMTEAELQAFKSAPDFTVIENSSDTHAVYINGRIMAVFYSPNGGSVTYNGVTASCGTQGIVITD